MLTIVDIVEALSNERPNWSQHVISGAVVDSRQAIPGSMFVAVPGDQVDGHDYLESAFVKGSVVALVQNGQSARFSVLDLRNQRDINLPEHIETPLCIWVEDSIEALQKIARYWRRKLNPRIIGITGSVGKTTSKEVIAEILNQRYRTLKNPGNLNNEIGLPLTLLSLHEGYERAVLEMGFYVPGEIGFLCDIALPQVGVITNVGTVHAERAGSQEAIAQGKAELVQALPESPEGVAILNYDDPWVRDMSLTTKARVFFYGLNSKADLWADNVEGLGLDGIRLRLHYRNEIHYLKVPLIGRHSVHTVLRAAAVGLVEDLTWQEIVEGLRAGKAQLRLVAVPTASGAIVLDDTYNASPESTLAALNLLDELEGRKVAVLGDMFELGQYERRGHEMIGVRATEVVDELITIGTRARIISDSAIKAGFSPKALSVLEDNQQVIDYLKNNLTEKDVVLIKGSRGMHMDRIVSALESKA
jgi:UDP-N-acetylmuramoyl-tripeptide--D-alanyl-D-alanine ligase